MAKAWLPASLRPSTSERSSRSAASTPRASSRISPDRIVSAVSARRAAQRAAGAAAALLRLEEGEQAAAEGAKGGGLHLGMDDREELSLRRLLRANVSRPCLGLRRRRPQRRREQVAERVRHRPHERVRAAVAAATACRVRATASLPSPPSAESRSPTRAHSTADAAAALDLGLRAWQQVVEERGDRWPPPARAAIAQTRGGGRGAPPPPPRRRPRAPSESSRSLSACASSDAAGISGTRHTDSPTASRAFDPHADVVTTSGGGAFVETSPAVKRRAWSPIASRPSCRKGG